MNIFYTKLGKFEAKKYNKESMGELHRLDGPAIDYSYGSKEWYQNGILHRIDGPAIEDLNCKFWYQNGLLHREDGPAIEYCAIESKQGYQKAIIQYWMKGKRYSEDKHEKIAKFYQEGLDILL